MSISEDQFKKMLKGTVHEGKYGTDEPQAKPAPEKLINKVIPKRKHTKKRRSEAEHLAGIANRVLPWSVGFKVFFTPATWVVIAIIIGIMTTLLGPVFNGVIDFFVGLAQSPLFFLLFAVNIVLIFLTINYLRK